MTKALPDIFGYIDFKKYLEDYYLARKTIEPGFTHSYICYKLGQPHSRSYFNNVIKGRVALSAGFIDLFVGLLELDAASAKYFRALVNYNQASSEQEREFHFDQIVSLNRTPAKLLDKDTYAYYKEWYHGAIRSLLEIIDFKNEYVSLARTLNPEITVRQAKGSIALLKKLGLVKENEQGFLKPADRVLTTGESVKDLLIRQYQAANLKLGCQAIFDSDKNPCKTLTYTMHISDRGYKRVIARMEQFRSELRSIIHKDEDAPNRVYQMNVQIFSKSKQVPCS